VTQKVLIRFEGLMELEQRRGFENQGAPQNPARMQKQGPESLKLHDFFDHSGPIPSKQLEAVLTSRG
jgi:hypothetical protein